MWPEAEAFLTEAVGLTFAEGTEPHSLVMDPVIVLRDIDVEWIRASETLVTVRRLPVGMQYAMGIYLGQDGMIYGGFDGAFGPLARSLPELVDVIFLQPPKARLTMSVD